MTGKLTRVLHGVRRMTPWYIVALLALVTISWSISILVQYLQAQKEHIETVYVWTPDHAIPIQGFFGGHLRFDSGYPDSVLWENTHTPDKYQQLDAVANFFLVDGKQIRYLAIVRKYDGTVSVARTTISTNIPDPGFLLEERDVTFDPATGMVTAQYTRPLLGMLIIGAMIPFLIFLLVSLAIGMACGFRLNEPIFIPRRVPS